MKRCFFQIAGNFALKLCHNSSIIFFSNTDKLLFPLNNINGFRMVDVWNKSTRKVFLHTEKMKWRENSLLNFDVSMKSNLKFRFSTLIQLDGHNPFIYLKFFLNRTKHLNSLLTFIHEALLPMNQCKLSAKSTISFLSTQNFYFLPAPCILKTRHEWKEQFWQLELQ